MTLRCHTRFILIIKCIYFKRFKLYSTAFIKEIAYTNIYRRPKSIKTVALFIKFVWGCGTCLGAPPAHDFYSIRPIWVNDARLFSPGYLGVLVTGHDRESCDSAIYKCSVMRLLLMRRLSATAENTRIAIL